MRYSLLFLLSTIYLLIPVGAQVESIQVTNTNDAGAGSLRDAIFWGPTESRIYFAPDLSGQTIILTSGQIDIFGKTNLEIDGSTLTDPLIISGNQNSRIGAISADSTVLLKNVTFINGQSPSGSMNQSGMDGGAFLNEGALHVISCQFEDNWAGNGGDGQDGADGADNETPAAGVAGRGQTGGTGAAGGRGANGGAIANFGSLRIEYCSFSGNRAGAGGVGGAGGMGGEGAPGVSGDGLIFPDFIGGTGGVGGAGIIGGRGGFGGAVWSGEGASNLQVLASTFSNNRAGDGGDGGQGGQGGRGGAGGDESAGSVIISSNDGTSGGSGGAGGFSSRGGTGGSGGAIFSATAATYIEQSTIAYNSSGAQGASPSGGRGGDGGRGGKLGDVFLQSGGDGGSGGFGGAILPEGLVENGNIHGSGGGLFLSQTATLFHCTISENLIPTVQSSAAEGGAGGSGGQGLPNGIAGDPGGVAFFGDTVPIIQGRDLFVENDNFLFTLWNSIVASPIEIGVTPLLSFYLADSSSTYFGQKGVNLTGTDPLLLSLADNGGPTKTMLPIPVSGLLGSQAINRAEFDFDPSAVDQRGLPRFSGGKSDIGAVEVQFPAPTTVYVASSGGFSIINPERGDTVVWQPTSEQVTGLLFGYTAFDSIQSAIDIVADGGTVRISGGLYSDGQEILINKSLSLIGSRSGRTIVAGNSDGDGIFENGEHRVFHIEEGDYAVTFERMHIINGQTPNSGDEISRNGAGVLNRSTGQITFIACSMSGNQSGLNGGAFANLSDSGIVSFDSCTIFDNAGGLDGGGIYNQRDGTIFVAQSTVSRNASFNGGGIYNAAAGIVFTGQSTICFNSAANGGGIFNQGFGLCIVSNSLIGGNTATTNHPDVRGDSFSRAGVNLVGIDGTPSGVFANSGIDLTFANSGATTISDWIDTNLADNGGPTLTHDLPASSLAIDRGSNIGLPVDSNDLDGDSDTSEKSPYDQRGSGFDRISNSIVDIGAVEFISPPQLVSFSPSTGTVGFDPSTPLILTFDEPIVAGPGTIRIRLFDDLSLVVAISAQDQRVAISGNTVMIDVSGLLGEGEMYSINIDSSAFTSTAGLAFAGLSGQGAFAFTTGFINVYVDQASDFTITTDLNSDGLGNGDTVIWKPGTSDQEIDLIFGTNAFTSVQNAVNSVGMGGTVFIAAGDYYEGSQIEINRSLLLLGDATGNTRLSGNDTHRVIQINDSATEVQIDTLSIVDGTLSGGTSLEFAGSGIYNDSSTLFIVNSVVSGNSTSASGGGILNLGTLIVDNSIISENSGTLGGGIYNFPSAILIINSCNFFGNSANPAFGAGGGAIYSIGTLSSVNNSMFSGNLSSSGGSAISVPENSGETSINHSTFSGNLGVGSVIEFTSDLIINSSTISGHSGIAIITNSNCIINSSTISENSLGIVSTGASSSPVTINNSTISGNFNGGIRSAASTLIVNNSTIIGNSAEKGGGISNEPIGGSGAPGPITLNNSIIAGNTATISSSDIEGDFTSIGVNFVGDTTDLTGFRNGIDLTFTSAQSLSDLIDTTLTNNGGPTLTHLLALGSPAIDAGDSSILGSLTTDQRGFARIFGSQIDIGAVEYQDNQYQVWLDHYYPGETDPAIIAPSAYPNQDGVSNGIAFLTGANPLIQDSISQPSFSQSGSILTFTIHQSDRAAALNPIIEYSTDLLSFVPVDSAITGITATLLDDASGTDFGGIGIDQIIIEIDSDSFPRFFLRRGLDLN